MYFNRLLVSLVMAFSMSSLFAQKQWTLQECIDYAMKNNISLQKSSLAKMSANEDYLQSKASLLPSLSASTNQGVNYRPFPYVGMMTVTDGNVVPNIDKVYYNGSYSVAGNWTVWNGNRNHNQVKLNSLMVEKDGVDSVTTARNIEEQILMLYIQILYTKENVAVQKSILDIARQNEERGKDMLEVGKISKADLMQLTAQRAQDEYNVVQAESQVRNYKRQLKALLQITSSEDFDVAGIDVTDEMALEAIPDLQRVYEDALENRPELKSVKMSIESADLSRKIAKAQRLPSIGLNASVGTNTSSQGDRSWGDQMKSNFSLNGGVNVSVPLFDQRQSRTAMNKAEFSRQQALLDLRDKQTSLFSTIENYWIQASNNQSQYKAAKVSAESAQVSYDLLSEQFKLGLKNIVQLQEGKSRLLSSLQNEMQSKFTTILNMQMLDFYRRK